MEGKAAKTFGTKSTQSTPNLRLGLATMCLVMLCQCNPSLAKAVELADGETEVENHVYFMDDQNNMIPADLTVTQQEEYISLEHADMVYDFSSGLMVYKSKRPYDGVNGCLVASFNMTENACPSDVKSIMKEDMILGNASTVAVRVTNVWLNGEALGPKSQALCTGDKIQFMEILGNKGDAALRDTEGPNKRQERALPLLFMFLAFLGTKLAAAGGIAIAVAAGSA